MRRRRETSAPAPWALLSLALRYPGPGAREQIAAEVAALPGGPAREALERFLAGWSGDPAEYVETFDLRRRACLHLTYYAHGDTRNRGLALLRLKKLYRAALELLRLSLHDSGSVYAHLLDAIAAGLAPLSVTDRADVARLVREGPPEEAVGLEPYAPAEAMP